MLNNILFLVAGNSGGHILPALEIGRRWKKNNPSGKIIFFCSKKGIDKKIILNSNFLFQKVGLSFDNFPGKKFYLYPQFIVKLIWTLILSIYFLILYRPEKIISTGGYISIPICVVSKLFRTKIELFELNVFPGKTVKALLPFANKIFVTFDSTILFLNKKCRIRTKFNHKNKEKQPNFKKKCFVEQYPLRFNSKDKIYDKNLIINKINGFSQNRKTIFLIGGSQGSVFLNNLFKKWLLNNIDAINNLQIIHQTGITDKTNWIAFYKKINIPAVVFDYDENIKDFYLIADLVISRAGAGTLFELEFFQKKSLIIPLESNYTSHQINNAYEMARRNTDLFFVQKQNDIKNDFYLFEDKINELLV
ncbi:hypothetical protein GF322_05015 [Candidatus Dependentiae bacterium]|nr:hypothetical protein [Candidatus Dependentiae bacterium]